MNSLCIVTDTTAQFTQSNFPGREHVFTLPLVFQFGGHSYTKDSGFQLKNLPHSADHQLSPRLVTPSTSEIRLFFEELGEKFNEILCIFQSASLNSCYQDVQSVIANTRSGPKIQIIDSHTLSVGIGLLVQTAARLVEEKCTSVEIERIIRNQIQHTYTILCTPNLSYLSSNGLVDYGQASISEYFGLYPLFGIEEGRLNPIDKMRNYRQAITFFQEYLEEFEQLKHIAWFHHNPENNQDFKFLKEQILERYGENVYVEQSITIPIAALLGPQVFGMIVVEE
jgi:DegV family protein with EDD domain